MKLGALTFWVFTTLWAADERQLALTLKAQGDFDRVELAPRPALGDAEACEQSQAAALSVSPLEEGALLHFRKGYCAMAGAFATGQTSRYATAAAEFDQALLAWPARTKKTPKNATPEPVSSGLRALAAISHVLAGEAPPQDIAANIDHPSCSSTVMPADFCQQMVAKNREWLGWMALRDGKIDEATRLLAGSTATGWSDWVNAKASFQNGSYQAAVTGYSRAIDTWKSVWQQPTLLQSVGPRPNVPIALVDLGSAQLLAGDYPKAIRSLDEAIKSDASNARAFYLRARARELSGQGEAALPDYNMASRTAFAAAQDLASGEAHLYRGILLYRRKDFQHAEDEFSSALNFEIAPILRTDAAAWRHLAAVAGGSCGSERELLNSTIAGVSPFFPTSEARALAAACSGTAQR